MMTTVAEMTPEDLKTLILETVQKASPPPLDGLPSELVEDLVELESLDDETLRQVMVSRVPNPNPAQDNHRR